MVAREVDGQHVFPCQCLLFIFVRLMVGLQGDGPLGVVLGGSQGLCGRSWAALRAFVGGPGPLSGPQWAVLGRLGAFFGVLGRLGSAFGCYVGGLGPMLAVLGLMLVVLGRSGRVCWRSWRLLGPLLVS